MASDQLKNCLGIFTEKHLDKGANAGRLAKSEGLICDLEHLIGQLQNILIVLKDKDQPMETNEEANRSHSHCVAAEEQIPEPDPDLVQVRASKAEMDRRIAAFLEKKRLEVNSGNCREFCSKVLAQAESCARVDAVFMRRTDSKGHVKVSKVMNTLGPQTQVGSDTPSQPPSRVKQELESDVYSGMQERVKNIADHLHMKIESRRDLAEQIRRLEERILYLESLSPEYFSRSNHPGGHNGLYDDAPSAKYQKSSIAEIDERIHYLKQSLKRKAAMMIKSEPF